MTGIGRHRSNSISALSRHTPPSHPFATMRVNTQLNVLKFSGKFQTPNRNWGIGMNKGLSVYCCCCFISITYPQCPPPSPSLLLLLLLFLSVCVCVCALSYPPSSPSTCLSFLFKLKKKCFCPALIAVRATPETSN